MVQRSEMSNLNSVGLERTTMEGMLVIPNVNDIDLISLGAERDD